MADFQEAYCALKLGIAEQDLGAAALCEAFRATPPIDPSVPVMVARDQDRKNAANRLHCGIPVGPNLLAQIKRFPAESGAPWLLTEA